MLYNMTKMENKKKNKAKPDAPNPSGSNTFWLDPDAETHKHEWDESHANDCAKWQTWRHKKKK